MTYSERERNAIDYLYDNMDEIMDFTEGHIYVRQCDAVYIFS